MTRFAPVLLAGQQANSLGTGDATLNVKIAAKPLQIETWLLLTTYKKSPAPYPIIPLPTFYDLPYSHNTSVTDRRRTDRQTDRIAMAKMR